MDENETRAAEDETPEERDIEREDGATPEESHRIAEFDDLSAKLDTVIEGLANITKTLAALPSMMIDNGGEVSEVAETVEDTREAEPDIPDYDDMDFNL